MAPAQPYYSPDEQFLFPDDALRLEDDLAIAPHAHAIRIKLLRFYSQRSDDIAAKERWLVHAKWMISEWTPDTLIEQFKHHSAVSMDEYLEIEKLFYLRFQEFPDSASLHGFAGKFFWNYVPDLSEKYFLIAEALDKSDSQWSNFLFLFYLKLAESENDRKYTKMALRAGNRYVSKEKRPAEKYEGLKRLANFSLARNDFLMAQRYAKRLLRLEPHCRLDYYLHDGYALLGRIALKMGSIGEAEDYLLRSADLNDFKPSVVLANELLTAGSFDVVIRYLDICSERTSGNSEQIQEIIETLKADQRRHISGDKM